MRALPHIILIIALCAALFYMESYEPEAMDKLLIQVDVFGLTMVGEEEQTRLQHIKNLSISYEEKQVLINRTVFMGATQEMVTLALGKPRKAIERPWPAKNVMLTYYVYYLPNDKRPTILIFQEDKLINAYKGSALDVGN